MIILTVYRKVLLDTPAVASLLRGGIDMQRVDQNALRPNIVLKRPEQGQDYSHQGPVGLMDAHIQAIARADTPEAAATLSEAIEATLRDWTGTMFGCVVQMTQHFNSMSDYEDDVKVFTEMSEYTSFYSRSA